MTISCGEISGYINSKNVCDQTPHSHLHTPSPKPWRGLGKVFIYVLHSFFKLVLQGSLAKVCQNLSVYDSIAYPAASLYNSIIQIRHPYTVFLGFREIYILEVPHFALISRIKMP